MVSMPTVIAGLAEVGWIDFDEHSASFFRFARELGKECRPRGITYALGKTMITKHTVHAEVFYADDAVGRDDLTAFLMGEVLPSPGDTLMNSCHDLTMLPPLWCALSKLRVLALYPGKGFLFLAEKPGVLDLSTDRQGS